MPPIFSLTHVINGFLQSHKLDECNELFVTGGPYTTPHITAINPCVPSPWRSACLFIVMLSLCLGFILVEQYARIELGNVKLFLAAVTVGNVFAPLSLVLLLSELNLWRNIQILRIGYQIAGGGLLSIAFALFMYLFSVAESPIASALFSGTVEELAKIIACVVLAGPVLRNGRVLNGLLIGAAVGAGFSLIESMGYTFESLLESGTEEAALSYEDAVSTMGLRALFAMTAGHVLWGAVSAGALWGCYRERNLYYAIRQPRFLLVLLFCILLHSGWNVCCFSGVGLPALPVLIVLTWGAMAFIIRKGIRQIRSMQQMWYDAASEHEGVFSLQYREREWSRPVSAAHLQELLDANRISRQTLCRAGDCTIPVPVSQLSFIPKTPERLCTWWRTPHCAWYKISFALGALQLAALVAAFIRTDSMLAVLVFALALGGEVVVNFSWLALLWRWAMRRFPQTAEEAQACNAFTPHSSSTLWWRMAIPVFNILWGYRLYVHLVRRFNAIGRYRDSIPLWIPRLYWGNITAAITLLITMALLHQGEANMWHFLFLVLLYPVLAFFMARTMNCMHRVLRTYEG